LNYETHVPSKALISYVGTTTTSNNNGEGSSGGKKNNNESLSSGYVMQLPLSMGTVIGYSPPLEEGDDVGGEEEEEEEGEFPLERMESGEPLFRILWDGVSATTTTTTTTSSTADDGGGGSNVVGYTEDLTLEELLPCLVTQPSSTTTTTKSSSSSSSRSRSTITTAPIPSDTTDNTKNNIITIPPKILTQTALSIHKHVHATITRKQLSLEEKMENELLPHLVILASLELRKEIAQKIRLELLLERKKKRVEMGLEKKKKKSGGGYGGGGEEIVNEDGMAYQYYMRHPNQYMSSFQAPPSLPSDDEESDCDDNEEDVDMEVEGGGNNGEGHASAAVSTTKRSKTKLSKQELITYNVVVSLLPRVVVVVVVPLVLGGLMGLER